MPTQSRSLTRTDVLIRSSAIALLSVSLCIRVAVILQTGFLYDDAFITFQYAHNLAHGNGLIYQTGEKVLGTTSPLFAILLAIPEFLGLPSPSAAPWFNLVFDLITIYLLTRQAGAGSARESRATAIVAIGFALEMLSPLGMEAGNGGMESALFRLLLVLFWRCIVSRYPVAVFVLSFLMSATRPEAPLYSLLLIFLETISWFPETRKSNWKEALFLLLASISGCSAEWAVVALTYGYPFPASIQAKFWYSALLKTAPFSPSLLTEVPLRFFGTPAGILVSVLYVYGLLWVWEKTRTLFPLVAVPLFYYPVLAFTQVVSHAWYFLPPLSFFYMGSASGILSLLGNEPGRRTTLRFLTIFVFLYPLFTGLGDGASLGVAWATPVVAILNSATLAFFTLAFMLRLKDERAWSLGAHLIALILFVWILVSFAKNSPVSQMKDYARGYYEANRALAIWIADTYPEAAL
ncbi:MAG: hypothetical protein V2G51_00005, partial [bacterium JZ-2024 1]